MILRALKKAFKGFRDKVNQEGILLTEAQVVALERKKLYDNLEELQKDLDVWFANYNNERTHQGKMCCWRTPMETLLMENGLG